MSDLISRSELLKRFCVNKDGQRIPERDCDNFEVTVSIKDVKTIINEQPTVYDIDKIVEELEKAKVILANEYYCKTINDKKDCENSDCFECCANYLIEIVKQGGISDDVCKWEYDKHFEFAKSKCGSIDTHRIEFNKLKYCPYCGKKIKVVE